MGRYRKGKGASRKDLWSLVGGEEIVVMELMKADLGCEDTHRTPQRCGPTCPTNFLKKTF